MMVIREKILGLFAGFSYFCHDSIAATSTMAFSTAELAMRPRLTIPSAFCFQSIDSLAGATQQQPSIVTAPKIMSTTTTVAQRTRLATARLQAKRGRNASDEDETDALFNVIDGSSSLLSRPISFGVFDPPIALGYPLALFAGVALLPTTTAIFLWLSFGICDTGPKDHLSRR